MNQFVAPQFIDVEDRIIGPITTRQFIMMIGAGVIVFAAYKLLDTASFSMVTLIVTAVTGVLGFVKINGRHFGSYVKSMVEAARRPKIRVWRKEVRAKVQAGQIAAPDESGIDLFPQRKTTVSPGHLAELALFVDTGGRYQG